MPTVEIAGMVDPSVRRGGIATALIDAALPLCLERGYDRALLVTPRASASGRAFALARGAALEHSEHALVLDGPPADGPGYPELHLRLATVADADELARVLTAAFGAPAGDMVAQLGEDTGRTIVVERHGAIVATVSLTREQDEDRIYGFAVDPRCNAAGSAATSCAGSAGSCDRKALGASVLRSRSATTTRSACTRHSGSPVSRPRTTTSYRSADPGSGWRSAIRRPATQVPGLDVVESNVRASSPSRRQYPAGSAAGQTRGAP